MDADLAAMGREALVDEVVKLRAAIRAHRDSSGHDLCWHHPRLWSLLPEKTDPLPVVPDWPEFLQGCVRYRQSLDEQAPGAPRSRKPYGKDAVLTVASMLWRRLNGPGHDACQVQQVGAGWRLEGAAVLRHASMPTHLAYRITCDSAWRTQHGHVQGWLGERPVVLAVARTQGGWTLNGRPVLGLEACVDLDLAFTPATNLVQIRRLALEPGESGDAPAAWLQIAPGSLSFLAQRYERRDERTYWYEAPGPGFAGLLDVDPAGFVTRYPGLWEAENH